MNPEIVKRLTILQVGGCTCMTKTPELQYHNERCTFRLASEIEALLNARQPVGYISPWSIKRVARNNEGAVAICGFNEGISNKPNDTQNIAIYTDDL